MVCRWEINHVDACDVRWRMTGKIKCGMIASRGSGEERRSQTLDAKILIVGRDEELARVKEHRVTKQHIESAGAVQSEIMQTPLRPTTSSYVLNFVHLDSCRLT
jgi:hypothetical protein